MNLVLFIALTISFCQLTHGWIPQRFQAKMSFRRRHIMRESDGPSDIDVTPVVEIAPDGPKAILLKGNGCSRTEINEYVLQLEKTNPTSDPAFSPLINGVWELVVSGVTSPGLVGYQIIKALPGSLVEASEVTLTISSVQPRAVASTSIKVGTAKVDISVATELVAETALRLREEFVSATIGSIDIPLSSVPIFARELLVTYLDEDLMIVRDLLGSPEILKRKTIGKELRMGR